MNSDSLIKYGKLFLTLVAVVGVLLGGIKYFATAEKVSAVELSFNKADEALKICDTELRKKDNHLQLQIDQNRVRMDINLLLDFRRDLEARIWQLRLAITQNPYDENLKNQLFKLEQQLRELNIQINLATNQGG